MDNFNYILVALYTLLFLVGFFGNIIVILYYGIFQKASLTAHHIFKIQLAIADLLVCTFVPVHMYEDYVMRKHIINKVYRYSTTVPMYVAVTVSALILCGMSYERYRKITRPFAEPFGKLKTCLICGGIWLFCLPLVYEGVLEIESPEMLTDKTLFCFHMVIIFVECIFPIVFMIWCYKKIAVCVKTNLITLKVRRQQNKMALKTLKQLLLIFAICVTPGRILIVVLNALAGFSLANKRNVALDYAIKFAAFLFFINNAVNCLVYIARDHNFRYWLLCQKARRKKFSTNRRMLGRKREQQANKNNNDKQVSNLITDNIICARGATYERTLLTRHRKMVLGDFV